MAGGPNAAIAPCMRCAGPADRTSDGLETDWYRCRACERTFGICWDGEPLPERPMWPITEEEADKIRALARLLDRP